VSVIDTRTLKVVKTLAVGDYPEGIAADPARSYVYVACWFDNVLMRIDTAKLAVAGEVEVGDGPRAFGLFLR
jgi:YVTN family beta-propeller protein